MSDNRSRHGRLAIHLSLITGRLTAGESLSLKTLSDKFGVTERTLQRGLHQHLIHLDLKYRDGRYGLRRQSSPSAIPEMPSFIQSTGIAQILLLRSGRLITCLTDNQEPPPYLIRLPAPDITATLPECFSQFTPAVRQYIHISLVTERWYPSLEPCRLIYYSGSWYLIALQEGKLRIFPLTDIKSVSLTSERLERRDHVHGLVAEERFISALPHFPFIHKLINTSNLWSPAYQGRSDRYGDDMLNRKLNIWLLRHFLDSHCIPSIIISNAVCSFQRSVMSTRNLFPLIFTVASFSTSVGNQAVKDGWCQTITEDGRALVMLKDGAVGITGLMQGYPNGIQTLLGSRVSINDNLIPASQMCSQQTGFRAVEAEVGQAPEMVKKAVHSIAEHDVSVLQAFDVRVESTRDDMLRACPKFITSLTGFSPKQTPAINKGSVLQAIRQAYAREYDEGTTETTDLGSYEVKGNEVEFEVFNPEDRAYDKVTVTIGADDNVTGISVEFIGRQPVCRTATLFYCPKALSHANKRLPSQQLTAMCLLKITREHISGWLSTMSKGSYTGGAGTLNLMPEDSQIRISPVKEFSGNRRLHFTHQATSSPRDAAFLFIPLIHS